MKAGCAHMSELVKLDHSGYLSKKAHRVCTARCARAENPKLQSLPHANPGTVLMD